MSVGLLGVIVAVVRRLVVASGIIITITSIIVCWCVVLPLCVLMCDCGSSMRLFLAVLCLTGSCVCYVFMYELARCCW